jgi:hypothetical protein
MPDETAQRQRNSARAEGISMPAKCSTSQQKQFNASKSNSIWRKHFKLAKAALCSDSQRKQFKFSGRSESKLQGGTSQLNKTQTAKTAQTRQRSAAFKSAKAT